MIFGKNKEKRGKMEEKREVGKEEEKINNVPEQNKRKREKGFLAGLIAGILGTSVAFTGILYISHMQDDTVAVNATTQEAKEVFDQKTLDKLNQLMEQIDANYYEDVDTKKMQEGLYAGLVEGLNDPYSAYYTEDKYNELMKQIHGNFYGIGAGLSQDKETMQVTITKIYDNTPAQEAGLEVGDTIVKVEDIDATSMELSDLVMRIRGEEGTTVHLVVCHEGASEYSEYDIKRAKVNEQSVAGQMFEDGIGYIYVSGFEEDTANQFKSTITELETQGMKAMIVDLRNNGGGMLPAVTQMLDDILPEGITVYMEDKYGNRQDCTSSGDTVMNYPMVVLVNEYSASASEIFAGAIRDYNYGTLIGTTTYGKGVVQNTIELPEGDAIKLTIAKYFTPKGENIQGTGIEPDISLEYEYTGDPNEAFDYHCDNQVAKAIEVLEGELQEQ